jgi:hypothetical protein
VQVGGSATQIGSLLAKPPSGSMPPPCVHVVDPGLQAVGGEHSASAVQDCAAALGTQTHIPRTTMPSHRWATNVRMGTSIGNGSGRGDLVDSFAAGRVADRGIIPGRGRCRRFGRCEGRRGWTPPKRETSIGRRKGRARLCCVTEVRGRRYEKGDGPLDSSRGRPRCGARGALELEPAADARPGGGERAAPLDLPHSPARPPAPARAGGGRGRPRRRGGGAPSISLGALPRRRRHRPADGRGGGTGGRAPLDRIREALHLGPGARGHRHLREAGEGAAVAGPGRLRGWAPCAPSARPITHLSAPTSTPGGEGGRCERWSRGSSSSTSRR